ncbi:MAG: ATP-binding cassette domain-containing protein [Pseudomonadota bacterium]
MTLILDAVSLPRGKVQRLSAEFAAGVHLIVGPNGVGKTSLLNAIAGTLPLSSGSIQVDGKPLAPGSRDVVLAPNAPPEIPWIRAGLLLEFIVSLYPTTRRDAKVSASIVERLGISGFLDSPLGTLSAGSARKLMLASALIAAPPVMLFDEPTNETDAASIAAFVDMVGEIAARNVVVITTHHAKDLESLAPNVLTLK